MELINKDFKPEYPACGGIENKPREYNVIAVDFDGTLCEDRFPEIGEPKPVVIEFVKRHAAQGTKIILHTCRENTERRQLLYEAVDFCAAHEIPLYAVNENSVSAYPLPYGTRPGRKVFADLYIDDKAVNTADIELTLLRRGLEG
jgi:ribonucleotide monophosphatase NagD (HAD superfamily)